ncbi:MAG: nucleoside recognition domain-containing protein [Planctomycetota bacterium]
MSNVIYWINELSVFVLPALIVLFPLYGLYKRVPVYEVFVEGAREGFTTAVRIIPYLVAILFSIGMLRASGLLDALQAVLATPMGWIGMPPDVLPMAIVRPLTGGGSIGVLADIQQVHGNESLTTRIAATIFGSTETTFYVIAVYFGAVGIKKTRHAVAAGLTADIAAIFIAIIVVRLLLGGV